MIRFTKLYNLISLSRQRKKSLDMKIVVNRLTITKKIHQKVANIILRPETIEINQAQLKQYDLLLDTRMAFVQVFHSTS